MSFSQLEQLEITWETEINKGNSFYQSSVFTEANTHYMNAMMASELLLGNIVTTSKYLFKLPSMYFIACINIANTFWAMKDINNASSYFLYCTYKMKKLTDQPGINGQLKEAASEYWLKAVQFYSQFSQITGTPILPNLDKEETYFQLQKMKNLFSLGKENMN